MYPQIPSEVVMNPLGSVEHTLGTTALVDTWQDILYTTSSLHYYTLGHYNFIHEPLCE